MGGGGAPTAGSTNEVPVVATSVATATASGPFSGFSKDSRRMTDPLSPAAPSTATPFFPSPFASLDGLPDEAGKRQGRADTHERKGQQDAGTQAHTHARAREQAVAPLGGGALERYNAAQSTRGTATRANKHTLAQTHAHLHTLAHPHTRTHTHPHAPTHIHAPLSCVSTSLSTVVEPDRSEAEVDGDDDAPRVDGAADTALAEGALLPLEGSAGPASALVLATLNKHHVRLGHACPGVMRNIGPVTPPGTRLHSWRTRDC